MPSIDLSILNQRQTPAFFADTLANRPVPSYVGRIFISTDTLDLYRDTGTAWVLLSPSSTGTITGSGAAGQVTYFSAASSITGNNNLFWDSANNRLGVNTNTPGASIDVHSANNTIAQFNQTTATNNSLLVLQNSGSALWRLGNYYNAGANDFGVFDVVGAIQPITIKKTTGQTFIGLETTSSGKLVVNSGVADNHIVVIGNNAPSIRVRNAGVSASRQFGLGLATTTNNYIQGTTGGEFCIFNDSNTPLQPILFGINTGFFVQEVARFSSSLNFLVGSSIDSGERVQINGNAKATSFIKAGSSSSELLAGDGSSVTAGSGITISGGIISSSGGGGGVNTANFSIAQIIDFTGAPSSTYTFASLFPSITTFTNKAIHIDMQFIYEQSPGNTGSFYYNAIRDKAGFSFTYSSAYTQQLIGFPAFPSFIFGGTNSAPDITFYLFGGGLASVNLTITLSS
jgi:hypothetical protein